MQLARWISGLVLVSLPEAGQRLDWSLDGERWHEAPPDLDDSEVFGEYEFLLGERWPDVLQTLLAREHFAEPVAWQIFHEAVALRYTSPRAAFVMALSAVEVGIKLLPASLSASASEPWLALEMPSPPLEKLISGYLPLLTQKRVRGKTDEVFPKRLRNKLVKSSERRNKLVHKNEPPPSDDEVAKTLATVYDSLYLLDWLSGQEWAIRRVAPEWSREYVDPT